MIYLGKNIKFLRKRKALIQEELAQKIGTTRAGIGSYEEDRAVPKLSVLQNLAYFFDVTIDELINTDLEQEPNSSGGKPTDIKGAGLRIISTIVDGQNKELITLVPVKASAGYLKGFADPEYIENLPSFAFPIPELSQDKTYRAFQIEGNSMDPIHSGSYIICEYIQNWNEIKNGRAYVFVCGEQGIIYKRAYNYLDEKNSFLLKSDNPAFEPFWVKVNDVREVWKAVGYVSFNLPEPDDISLSKLTSVVMDMKQELDKIKNNS